jgi:hypothetical protein
MMGDRYGEIVKLRPGTIRKGDKIENVTIAYVKLDKSGKTMRFLSDDCEAI